MASLAAGAIQISQAAYVGEKGAHVAAIIDSEMLQNWACYQYDAVYAASLAVYDLLERGQLYEDADVF